MPAAESSHAQRVLSSLNQQRAVGRFCDAVLNVGGGVVYLAHRSILACFSELFQQPNMPTAPCTEFCLEECPNDGLELLLNFVYTGELKLDPENLDNVKHAATSLCVPEALTLCQQFKDTSVDPAPFKRKRGRPRKSTSDTTLRCSVKEENLVPITKGTSSFDTAPTHFSMAATTTTRCGRVVKGPRRLIIDLQADINENSVSQAMEKEEEEEEEEDDVGDFEGMTEETDEEYVPVEEPSSLSPSTSTARRRKAQSQTDGKENGEAVEEDSKKDSVQCPSCDKSFKSKYYLKVHNRKENLLLHEIRDCTKVQTYTCVTCSSTFKGKEELRLHVVTHTGTMPHKCSTCPEQFMHKKNLTIHMMKVHGYPKPHAKNNLNMHLRIHSASLDKHHRTHTGERPFGCDVCEQRFTEKGALVRHKASKHEEGRPHSCHICGKTFKAREQLRVHLRRHKGMRKFECIDCGYKFTRQAHLRRHIQIHKRTENYNPRQRKLRNVIVQEVDQSPDENGGTKEEEESLVAEDTYCIPETADVQDSDANPEADFGTGLSSSCMVRGVTKSSDVVMEEVVSNQDPGYVEAEESFSVSLAANAAGH
ncbi:hypothetical protein FQN60_002371 [Etheostoma spectabile]|uniref:BTB domain-containing protein n=1 Tax=Etheostoma spectabile TaxID=54343 RepID=A0A5J5D9P2_9PERO|nr:hypothetical protein FQN60_002371 [Etheostoma spectabile]